MKEETKNWITFSEENLEAGKILLESQLYNPCLHNIQQSIEKALKSLFIELGIKLKKSHRISELRNELLKKKIVVHISEDDCDLMDSIYLPTKYPIGSALPDFFPDEKIAKKCLSIAESVLEEVRKVLSK